MRRWFQLATNARLLIGSNDGQNVRLTSFIQATFRTNATFSALIGVYFGKTLIFARVSNVYETSFGAFSADGAAIYTDQTNKNAKYRLFMKRVSFCHRFDSENSNDLRFFPFFRAAFSGLANLLRVVYVQASNDGKGFQYAGAVFPSRYAYDRECGARLSDNIARLRWNVLMVAITVCRSGSNK